MTALDWTERLVALAVALQTIELLQIRRACRDDGVWSWPVLKLEHGGLPAALRAPLGWVLPYDRFMALLGVRLACALALIATGWSPLALVLLFSQLAICVRFRGTFNGGSDTMTVVVLLSLSVALHPALERAAVVYIAVQVSLSYVIAGLAKLRQREWRSGAALQRFLQSDHYGAPAFVRELSTPSVARVLSFATIGFECTFPLALIDPRLCLGWLSLGLCFHVANAVVFGLNRFLFAWAAAYPALLACSQLLDASA